ncbi:MAG: hypothetical protein FJ319_01935 [SAR202 cluster bacterium]|nr:hypothetical protein [SAR202 cluster bacterium]
MRYVRFPASTRVAGWLGAAVALIAIAVAGMFAWTANAVPADALQQGAASGQPAETAAHIDVSISPIDAGAPPVYLNVEPAVTTASRSTGMAPISFGLPESSDGPALPVAVIVAIGGALMVVALATRRRNALLPLAVVSAVALSAFPAYQALAGSATATEWNLPHSFSYTPYALVKDAPNQKLCFAESIIISDPSVDRGRIGQLDLATNNLVEWPTNDTLGGSMAIGFGGKLYFTEPFLNIIGALDPEKDTFTRWQIPTAGGDANLFWVDGSGNPWYVTLAGAKVGRLNPDTNAITEWTLATTMCCAGEPHLIKFYGRDSYGNIWFSLPSAIDGVDSQIGRLNRWTNNLTLWPVPNATTANAAVIVVNGTTVWFSGHVRDTTLHVASLDTTSNKVTRWTVAPTTNPNIKVQPIGYYEDLYGYGMHEIDVAKGHYRKIAVVDSDGRPWFLSVWTRHPTGEQNYGLPGESNGATRLMRLDPLTNQLLEYSYSGYKLLDITASDVISSIAWTPRDVPTIVYFNTKTNSKTAFDTGGNYTTGFLRVSETEIWIPVSAQGNSGKSKIQRIDVPWPWIF